MAWSLYNYLYSCFQVFCVVFCIYVGLLCNGIVPRVALLCVKESVVLFSWFVYDDICHSVNHQSYYPKTYCLAWAECKAPMIMPNKTCVAQGQIFNCMETSGHQPSSNYSFYYSYETGSVVKYEDRLSVSALGDFFLTCTVTYARPECPQYFAQCNANLTGIVYGEYEGVLAPYEGRCSCDCKVAGSTVIGAHTRNRLCTCVCIYCHAVGTYSLTQAQRQRRPSAVIITADLASHWLCIFCVPAYTGPSRKLWRRWLH